jgi:hypothetical protein
MKLYKKRRKDNTSEDTHVTRGVIGTIIVIGLMLTAFYRYGPYLLDQSSASAPVAKVQPTTRRAQ